ncbi:hypothetical protein TNCV_852191 [Trichonephila clavipes]|nr:hypothetical protein TNCV_852191 [Trichonephila clavipes]
MQMERCKYGENRRKAWISPALSQFFKLAEAILWFWWRWGFLGTSSLIRVKERLNVQEYFTTIADQVHPTILKVYPALDGFFWKDNASCNTAGIVHRWFEDHDRYFILLS